MDGIFRLSGSVERDPAIDAWFDGRPPELGAIARQWFGCLRECGQGDIRELVHDGYPTVCIGDAALGYVGVFTHHVNIGFFHGAELDDPAGLLEGRGRRMRHVKLRPGTDVDSAALEALVQAAYVQLHACLEPWRPVS